MSRLSVWVRQQRYLPDAVIIARLILLSLVLTRVSHFPSIFLKHFDTPNPFTLMPELYQWSFQLASLGCYLLGLCQKVLGHTVGRWNQPIYRDRKPSRFLKALWFIPRWLRGLSEQQWLPSGFFGDDKFSNKYGSRYSVPLNPSHKYCDSQVPTQQHNSYRAQMILWHCLYHPATSFV